MPKFRTVEYFRCWEDHSWDTDFIQIPSDTPNDKLEEAVREAASRIQWKDDEPPCFTGLYCSMDDEPEEDEEEVEQSA